MARVSTETSVAGLGNREQRSRGPAAKSSGRHRPGCRCAPAAMIVPQGMAYAELAGLPAVNGLYTTVACLVGYAIFGPSRVLVLGPDSSLGPLIFAAIIPLAVTDNPTSCRLRRLPGAARGRDRGRARDRQAGLRRRPALEGGAGRLHDGPGRDDRRRPAPEAVRFLHRRGRLHRRRQGLRERPRPTQSRHADRRVWRRSR